MSQKQHSAIAFRIVLNGEVEFGGGVSRDIPGDLAVGGVLEIGGESGSEELMLQLESL